METAEGTRSVSKPMALALELAELLAPPSNHMALRSVAATLENKLPKDRAVARMLRIIQDGLDWPNHWPK
jgi:hypothetical protein